MIVMAELTVDQAPMRAGERYAMPEVVARDLVAVGHARNIGAFPPPADGSLGEVVSAVPRARAAGTYRTKGVTRG